MAAGNRSRVNESLHPARLGREFHHETHPQHTRADHQEALAESFCEAVDRSAADRQRQDRRRGLSLDRGDADVDPKGDHQDGLHRAWIPVGERLCRIIQREVLR